MFQKAVPWIALVLLLFIGGKMLIEGIRNRQEEEVQMVRLSGPALLVQGIATSIDALSVGFALIIGVVTYFISRIGLQLGKKAGEKLSGRAEILGGCILIFIGIEIFIRGVL